MALDSAKKRMAGILDVMLMPDTVLGDSDMWAMIGQYDFFDVAGVSPVDVVEFVLWISRARASDGVVVRSQDFVARVV